VIEKNMNQENAFGDGEKGKEHTIGHADSAVMRKMLTAWHSWMMIGVELYTT